MKTRHEILIVGGGLVGAALAKTLADGGWDTALVESRRPEPAPAPSDDFGLRVSAVSPSAQKWLAAIGVWPKQGASRICPYQHMHVWTTKPPGKLVFEAGELGLPALGYIAENRLLIATMWARLQQVTLYCPARLSFLSLDGDKAQVRLEDGRLIETNLVIGADGGGSPTRRMAGLQAHARGYGQRGLVAVAETENPHRETAWQRFLPDGPLALLPLADGRVSIVWSAPEDQVRALERLPETDFRQELEVASKQRLGRVNAVGPRASFPLQAQYVPEYVMPRLALVGDAAHVVHPLAGQGVNLGFMDAAALQAELANTRSERADPGELRRLRRYARARKGDNLAMLGMTDALHRLFIARNPLAGLIRGPGLSVVDTIAPAKALLMGQATGG